MPIKEKMIHTHPSAVAIFIPGFGDNYAKEEVIVVETVEGEERDISSIQISMTVKNTPGTFSMVLQDDKNKFIIPDKPEIEIPKLYDASQKKKSYLAYTDTQKIIVHNRDELFGVFGQDPFLEIEGPSDSPEVGRNKLNKIIYDIKVVVTEYYAYPIDANGFAVYDPSREPYQPLVVLSQQMNEKTGVKGVEELINNSTDPVYDPASKPVAIILLRIEEYNELEPKVKKLEEDSITLRGTSVTDPTKNKDQPFISGAFKPSFESENGNYYEHSSYNAWLNFPSYILMDISHPEGNYKTYPTQYIRKNGGDIMERWALLDDSSIVFISTTIEEEKALVDELGDENEIAKPFRVSPYIGPEVQRLFRLKRVTNRNLTEDYRDVEEQGAEGFKKGRCKINPMDRVIIFTTPRFDVNTGELNQNNKGYLVRAFTGVVNTVQQGYANGHHQITIQGEDVSKYLRISIINVNPALDLKDFYEVNKNQNSLSEPINIWSQILLDLTTPEIIRLVTLGSAALKTKGTALNQAIDGVGWYKLATGGPETDLIWDASSSSIKKLGPKEEVDAKYNFEQMLGELFKGNSVHIIDPYRPGGTSLRGFRPYELKTQNNWSFYQADFKTRRDIAYKAAEDSQFNFYADRFGHIWFHPYRFDATWILSAPNPKVYIIDNASIVSFGFVDDDSNIFTSVYVSTEPDFMMEEVQKLGFYSGSFRDDGAMLRYGQRIFVATNPIINTKNSAQDSWITNSKDQGGVQSSGAVTMYAKSLLQRILAGKYQGQITISGRPELEPGRPVYVPIRNMIYYVESVEHALTFGSNFETTIHLSYGRKPWEYLPELLTFALDDDIYAADAYTFRETYYNPDEEYKGPKPERKVLKQNMPKVDTADLVGKLAWGNHPNVSKAFIEKVMTMCNGVLKTNPNWLMACMDYESAHTFSASEINPSSGAVGLIQFLPVTCTALYLNISITAAAKKSTAEKIAYRDIFKNMSEEEQLTWVYEYMKPYAGRLNSLADVYVAIFAPSAVGKAPDTVLYKEADDTDTYKPYYLNRQFDLDNDKKITKEEATSVVETSLANGLLPGNVLGTE